MPDTRRLSGSQKLRRTFAAVALGTLATLGGTAAAHAQYSPTHLRVGQTAYGATQYVSVGVDKSLIVDLPADAREVIVSQPGVAGAIMRSARRAIIQGSQPGDTNIFFLDGAGQPISVIEVSVTGASSTLAATIRRVVPGSDVSVQSFGDRVVISGTVETSGEAERVLAVASQFVGNPENVANLVTVKGSEQVMLRVTIAEVRREVTKDLGINLSGSLSVGQVDFAFNSQQTPVANTNGYGGVFNNGNLRIDAQLRALEQRGALRYLAEPTLTALSGQRAEFLAGGELPILVVRDGETVTDFKPYGVELYFTPTIRPNGMISIDIETSVSEIAVGNALTKRGAKTSVELPAGATLSIGGIIQDRLVHDINALPGLANIPILGALFRSREYQRNQTELVILVTPYLARPTHEAVVLPTDLMVPAGDAEAVFLGHIEKTYGVGPHGMRGGYSGSVGFMLD
ncbi:type II and III secretion system protein family protein [Arsenicitalea aurantiaca]|uniref:Type II and III secretion system protein family protein n=1 Tax=Arsenicitalea aurantiaca TaxID=1783274 RepID=A0A433X2C7_9HYPH|nr:type II and III secretion system protein family protein [Arsenicitalea aurantiaca]RUT28197.1 type II and III secretion system protein family protein [Arsenicitalea aurantiaca]